MLLTLRCGLACIYKLEMGGYDIAPHMDYQSTAWYTHGPKYSDLPNTSGFFVLMMAFNFEY